ncbi:MAG: hypothetical protein ACRCZM_05950, partial [Bacteroidales bacterium]
DQESISSEDISNRYNEDTKHRRVMVYWTMAVVSAWLLLSLIILVWVRISDNVKITLLTTTTANILGLPYIILKGLFREDKK